MAEENKKLNFNAETGKWENLPEGYKIQDNKNYKIGDKTVAVLYTYQPYWSEYETVLLVADGKDAHYTVTTIPRNFDFSRVDSLDYDYKSAVANQQVRYELSWQFPGIVPRYEKNLFGFGFQPVFDDLEKAKEYGKRMCDVLVSCPTELLGKSFTKDHNPHYTYLRHDYIELNEYKVRDGIPVIDRNIYRVPVLLAYESDMFAVVDALKDKGYDIKGDGIKNVWYMDFDTEAGAKDFARALHAAMVDNDNLSRPYADLMKMLSNPTPDTDGIIYERIYFMEEYAKMMSRYGEGALDIDLAGKGVTTLDQITGNLPSSEINTMRYDNGKMTFFGQDGNSYRIEHLSGESIKSLIEVENEVLESEERSRSPKENPYYFCIANLTENYLKEEFDKTLSFNTPRYLELAREEDWNYTLTTDLIYKSPLRQKGDEVIAKDSEYTVVFNRDNGESYHIYRNITEEDVRKLITLPSSGLNLGDNPTEDVKDIARRIEGEHMAELANMQANIESPKINIDMEENKEKTYYLSVAYLQESDAKEYLDKYRESDTKALLYEAANWDQGDDIVQSNVYSRQGVHPGDITLVQDENYAVIYNATVGGTYEVLRKITEQDIRRNIETYGIETDATETVKKIAYAMVKEEFQSIKKEPAFEMPSGDILSFQYNEETNKVEVGTVTNAGLAPLHEFDYDHDYTLDENIGDIYSKLSDMEEYQPKEALQPERVSFDNKEDLKAYINDYCEKHGWDSDLNHIDVSRITDMSDLFYATTFTGDISKWDTSNVTNMSCMFQSCHFNGDISGWDVSNVRNMNYMFLSSYFNGDISNWDTSNVRGMECMFAESSFNGDISNWNVSNVRNMSRMFSNSEFTGDISQWDVSNVRNMNYMFANTKFGGDISNWDVSNVRNMLCMFFGAEFDGNISNWDTANVKNMAGMFQESKYSGDISKWDISNVRDMSYMFCNSKIKNIPDLSLRPDIKTKNMLINTPFEGHEKELKTLQGKTKPYTLPEQDVDMVHEVSPEQTKDAYAKIKQKNPEAIVICNGGDGKYRIFGKDAEFVSRELGIALDKRHSDGMSMITFTQREKDINLPKIIRSGRRAAIIEGTPDFIGENVKVEEEKPQRVNIVDKWKELKEQNPDKVILLHDDGRYMSYDNDAREICKALKVYTLRDNEAGLPLAYWEDKGEYADRYDKVLAAIDNLSVWDITNPDTKEARQRAIVRKEEQPAEVKTWQELKEADPKNVVLTLKDGRCHFYQEDAKAVSKILGLELTKREDYVLTTSFPATALDVYGKRIKASGHNLILTEIDYSAPVKREKIDDTIKESAPKVDPIEKWKELKAQNPDKITLMEHSTGYLVLGKDADAIPVNMGIIHEKFDTSLGTGLIVSSLYRDLDRLQKEVGQLAVWNDVDSKDIKVTIFPEEKMEQVQNEQQSQTHQAGQIPEQNTTQEEIKPLSPMRQQWENLKKENPDKVILLKSGGFYHTYEEDAKRASEILGITLTKNTKENCYMAGFPVTVLDEFLPKLNKANCPVELRDTVQHNVTSAEKTETQPEKKEEQKTSEKKATTPQETDEAARVSALKGEAYQAYLLDKALGNAAKNGGVFVNERKMAAASLFPHNDVVIPAFNNVIMTMHTERMGYATNTYTTYRGAQSMGLAVKRNEKCLGVNNFGISFFVNTFNSNDVIPKAQYNQLPDDKKQQYRPANKMSGFRDKLLLYNIDQTNTSSRNKEVYKKLVTETHREKKASSGDAKDNIRKYDELVKKNPNSMPLFRTGHFYESYKEGALVLNHLFNLPIVEDKKKGCRVCSFPASKVNQYLPKIAKQYHVSLIESSDIINGRTTIDYRKEASDFIKKVAKEMGVKIDKTTYMLTSYDKKDDTISLHVNNLDPGKPNSTDIKDINAMYRAISNAAEIPDRLDRSGRIVLNYGDCEKYDALVTELAAASLMIKQGLPARISEENMELIPYWQRELRENPKMVNILELNTNATIKAIMRHYDGKDVDYSKLRGTSQRVFLPEKEYTIVRDLATYPNVENRSAVIIRDPETKEAAVILPAGASTEVNNEIPGMNKHRYELALKKEGYENVKFFNADGYLSLNQPNSYFKDKDVTVEQLYQYDLVEVMKLDLTKELERYEKPEIEKIRGLKNDKGHYELYIKPVGKPEFTVKAQYADVTAFYKSLDNPNKREGEETRKAIGQKYYELVKTNPEFLTNLLNPNTEGINIDRLESVNVTKDPDTKKPLFSVKIDGQRYEKTVPNEIWQRFWTTSDPATYKRAYAAVLFEKELGRKETQDESIGRESPDTEEKKPVPVEIQDDAIDGQDNTTEPDIEQDDKKEIRRGGRGR